MNTFTRETNTQVQDGNESVMNKSAELGTAGIAKLEPWQLELVGGGEMIVSWSAEPEPAPIAKLEPWQLALVGGGEMIVSW